ncbi:hypothetical protein H5410_031903 [Solanum commersonii]|uniref:Uncharacterized protein n=1 Tax=Solanum commersonii TaxID=4109 RepID=A0A9J5YKL1_SOLCO|nr:hypothetical protein H5410_031903 [Solanum commersonii]
MTSSSKSLESRGNNSLAMVSVASPPNIILVTEDRIAHIVSLNGSWFRSSVEGVRGKHENMQHSGMFLMVSNIGVM